MRLGNALYICDRKKCVPEDNPSCRLGLCQLTTDPVHRDKGKGAGRFRRTEIGFIEKPKESWANVKQRKKRKKRRKEK